MKDWQKGYELEYLLEIENTYKKYNAKCISPFLEMKKNRVAERLSEGNLVLGEGFKCVCKKSNTKQGIKIYSSRPTILAEKKKGDYEISKLQVEDLKEFKKYVSSLDGDIWLLCFESDEEIAKSLGMERIGCKYTSFGDVQVVYYLEKKEQGLFSFCPLVYTNALDRATCINLNMEFDVEGLISQLEKLSFSKHYSNYNTRNSWSALSLRGWSEDPSFIIKPSEMNKRWHKKNKDQTYFLQDTPLYDDFPQVKEIISQISKTCEQHRIRFMKLNKGCEIGQHTDLVDPDIGVNVGDTPRFHIPLITNENCIFEVWGMGGKESFHMKKGELWYLDTRKPHRVINGGEDRTHLVFDLVADDPLLTLLSEENRKRRAI